MRKSLSVLAASLIGLASVGTVSATVYAPDGYVSQYQNGYNSYGYHYDNNQNGYWPGGYTTQYYNNAPNYSSYWSSPSQYYWSYYPYSSSSSSYSSSYPMNWWSSSYGNWWGGYPRPPMPQQQCAWFLTIPNATTWGQNYSTYNQQFNYNNWNVRWQYLCYPMNNHPIPNNPYTGDNGNYSSYYNPYYSSSSYSSYYYYPYSSSSYSSYSSYGTMNMSVSISNMMFQPSSISVQHGTTVTWTNNDSVPHTVTGNNGGPSSAVLQPGQTYSYTFNQTGTFPYHCSIHPYMTGTVTVY
jgi:plastocyanin